MRLNVAARVVLFISCGVLAADSQTAEECDSKTIITTMQTACKQDNEVIVHAESTHNYTEVCRHVPLAFKCALAIFPQCYTFIESTFLVYFHTPSNCEMTQQLIKELQDLQKGVAHSSTESPHEASTGELNPDTTQDKGEGDGTNSTSASSLPDEKPNNISESGTGGQKGHHESHKKDKTHNDASSVTLMRLSELFCIVVLLTLLRMPELWS